MRNFIVSFSCLLVDLQGSTACKQQDETNPCTYPHQVTINSTCYTGNGVELTATDYGNSSSGFEWSIIALKDTSKILGWTPKDVKIDMFASDKFTVPDSLVTNYQRLIITVATNCQGLSKHSIYYGFIKSKSTATNCIMWTSQAN
ncbi:hypothetical protein [Spirosoma flavum]|uniref:Uncharacterized protein n=1 Tax=Spirosoma flavum TaxID=2048557 RepID=A0ABW6AJG5_9BACT